MRFMPTPRSTDPARRSSPLRRLAHFINRLRPGGPRNFTPTGWPRVDRTVAKIHQNLPSAPTEERFQIVGLLCREALISTAQVVCVKGRQTFKLSPDPLR